MAYGRVSDVFWHDQRIRALDDEARFMMLYLMSCPHGNRVGCFVLAVPYAAEDLQWSTDTVTLVLERLCTAGRIAWDRPNRVVFVRHYLRHNSLANQSVVKGALNELRTLPDTPLLEDLLRAIKEAQRGPDGKPALVHYQELEEKVQERISRQNASDSIDHEVPPSDGERHDETDRALHSDTHGRKGMDQQVSETSPYPAPSFPTPSCSSPVVQEVKTHSFAGKRTRVPVHDSLHQLWTDGLEAAVKDIWHQGQDPLVLDPIHKLTSHCGRTRKAHPMLAVLLNGA